MVAYRFLHHLWKWYVTDSCISCGDARSHDATARCAVWCGLWLRLKPVWLWIIWRHQLLLHQLIPTHKVSLLLLLFILLLLISSPPTKSVFSNSVLFFCPSHYYSFLSHPQSLSPTTHLLFIQLLLVLTWPSVSCSILCQFKKLVSPYSFLSSFFLHFCIPVLIKVGMTVHHKPVWRQSIWIVECCLQGHGFSHDLSPLHLSILHLLNC